MEQNGLIMYKHVLIERVSSKVVKYWGTDSIVAMSKLQSLVQWVKWYFWVLLLDSGDRLTKFMTWALCDIVFHLTKFMTWALCDIVFHLHKNLFLDICMFSILLPSSLLSNRNCEKRFMQLHNSLHYSGIFTERRHKD